MRIDVLARRWGGPDGGPDGMAVAAAFLAWTLCELGHEVRGYHGGATPAAPWTHPRMEWIKRQPLERPDGWDADLVITTIVPAWRRTAMLAREAGAGDRLVYWHHFGAPPPAYDSGAILAAPPSIAGQREWPRHVVLPPSSWAAEAGGTCTGTEILIPGAGVAKGGHVAAAVARLRPDLSWYVLPGRSSRQDLGLWAGIPGATIAPGQVSSDTFLSRARAVLAPTRQEVHPLTLVEAAARGIPIVCSDLPGTRAACGAGALYVPAAAPPEVWARTLEGALQAPPPREKQPPYAEVVADAIERMRPTGRVLVAVPAPARAYRPKVVIVADVRTWAWARKARALKQHLGDEFDVEIVYQYEHPPDPIPLGRDLYHTFEVFQFSRLPPKIVNAPATTGMTAHVWPTWEAQHGAGTVRRWAANARAFHCNSLLLVREMEALLQRPIAYTPNGVDETLFRRLRSRRTHQLVVGWVGKPNPRKGKAIVAEACARAGVELRTIERRHTNALGPEDMREFYQDLHVLCVASDMDGTPNPALEAAACGVAIVSNRIGNMPEFIEDGVNGRLVERNADSMAAALSSLDVPTAIRMGEAARATIERAWTWRDLSRNYAAMWSDVLRGVLGRERAA